MNAKFHSFLLVLFSLLLIIGLTGCAAGSNTDFASLIGLTDSDSEATATKEEQQLDEEVFPKDEIIDVKITIDEDEFQNMLDNASAEEMHEASIDYNGQHFDNVGIRTKGNLSLNSVVNMADSDRYSFKLSFDEYVSQTLAGISKINLNNNYSDASYMREFLSYELAESMGLPTPKYSYVNVYVNGELWGFYLAVEQIGDAYLERNFGNSYGALYKANGGNGSELNWLETIDAYTGLDLKSDKSNDDILLTMLDELNNGTDYESVLDVEEALKFIALNAVAGNMDSYLSEKKHNYYLYENDGIFNILPWDYNMSFGGFGGSGILIDEPTSGTLADRPLVAKLLENEAYLEQYHSIIAEMLDGYLSEAAFAKRTTELSAMISESVKADPSAFYTYEQYEQGVAQVVSFNFTQTASIAQQLDGTIPSSGDGTGSGSSGMGGGGRGGGFGGQGGMGGMMQEGQGGANGEMPRMPNTQEGAGSNGASQNESTAVGTVEDDASVDGNNGQPPQGDAPAAGNGQQPAQGNANANGQQGGIGGGQGGFGGGGFGGGGMGGPGGMGGMGGFGGQPGQQAAAQQGTAEEAYTAGIAIIILLLSCVFVVFYKRRRF
jgi:spore coat protein H